MLGMPDRLERHSQLLRVMQFNLMHEIINRVQEEGSLPLRKFCYQEKEF